MKYGRFDIHRNLRSFTSERIEQKAGMTLVRLLLIVSLSLMVGIGAITIGIIQGLVESAPDISNLDTAPTESATYIYDSEGNEVQKLSASTSNRIPVSIEQIPQDLQHAIVAIEDERFYVHNGIDIRGIMRAFAVGIKNRNFSEGASTITQQLLKNSVFTDWTTESSLIDSFKRKFQEQYLALRLEDNLEEGMDKINAKLLILENYLNTINLGAGTYGVQAAAHRYFGKDVSELSLSECTVIAGITQNPTGYNPILYPQANAQRRKQVLNHMLQQNYITTQQFEEALADPVYDRIQEAAALTDDSNNIYSYYTDALIDQVLDDLVNIAGYTTTQASRLLYSGGLKIFSAQDSRIQKICDEEFNNPGNYPEDTLIGLDYALSVTDAEGKTIHYGNQNLYAYFHEKDSSFRLMFENEETARSYAEEFKKAKTGPNITILGERISFIPQPQASLVIIDQATGHVKAIEGGRGAKEASLILNRATSTRRQPGSTFKPLAVYAPALEYKNQMLSSVYENSPYSYDSGEQVLNWDSDYGYDGYETIRTAIARSTNVIAVKAMSLVTPQTGLDTLESLGITTLYNGDTDEDGNIITDAYPSLALGGITDGVVNLELTAAYAALANGGSYIVPKFYTRVEDNKGNVILENVFDQQRIFSEETSFLITQAMRSVISDPVGTAYHYISMGDMPACGKSGTTDSYRDIWFEGYTPYYTCGIWGGYDNNEPLTSSDDIHSAYAKILWNSIMNRIHEDLPVKEFEIPAQIQTAQICNKSGELAVPGLCDCDPRGDMTYTEYYKVGTVPEKTCSFHTEVRICSQSNLIATDSCTESYTKIGLNLPDHSSTETEDYQYAVPAEKCAGHKKQKEETKPTPTPSPAPDTPNPSTGSGNTIIVDGQIVDEYYYNNNSYDYDTYNDYSNSDFDFDSIQADNYLDNGITIY